MNSYTPITRHSSRLFKCGSLHKNILTTRASASLNVLQCARLSRETEATSEYSQRTNQANYVPTKSSPFTIQHIGPAYLRDACQCPRCVDPSSKQKLFETADIPKDIRVTESHYSPERKGWFVVFDEDVPGFNKHQAFIPDRTLPSVVEQVPQGQAIQRTFWDRAQMEKDVLWIDYKDYMSADSITLQVLQRVRSHGLVFLQNVPDNETSVIKIVERIGTLRDTFYGRTFNVRSVPNAKNIAYTNQYLGLHMDLLPFTNPPHLQMLHSLRSQASGGESMFSDSYFAAERMRQLAPQLFATLCFEPITFHYDHYPSHNYSATRTTIELDIAGMQGGHGGVDDFDHASFFDMSRRQADGSLSSPRTPHITHAIKCVNWSPPFQAPLRMNNRRGSKPEGPSGASWMQFSEALKMFKDSVNADENVFELKLKEGECVIFDNRRVLHARRAFDPRVGERWLKGAYCDDDVFYSRLRVLERAAAEGK